MASKRFQESCELPADIDRSFAALTDEAFVTRKYSGSDSKNTQVTITATDTGCHVRIDRLIVFDKPVPPVARPFVGDSLQIVMQQNWQRQGDGYIADLDYQVEGLPVSLSGSLSLQPTSAEQSNLSADITATVKLPLIGSKGATLLADAARKRIIDDFQKNQQFLQASE